MVNPIPGTSAEAVSPATGFLLLVKAAVVIANFQDAPAWVIATGGFTQDPDRQVIFRNTGGRPGEPSIALDYPTVQLLVRSHPGAGGYDEGYAVTRAMVDALLGIPNGGLVYPELVSVTAIGHINDLGRDDKGRPQFSYNFQTIVSYASSGYRV